VDHSVDVDGNTPAALGGRDVLGMTGTKFGCGMTLCGACIGTASARRVRFQCVVARRPSSRPASARVDAPVHVAATRRYRSGALLWWTVALKSARAPAP
jgi:hypothetical protein